MLKREIGPYKDYDGEMRSSIWCFDISQPELVELEVEFDAGFEGMIQKIIDTRNRKELVAIFKRMVVMGVGEQFQDGSILRFRKTDDIRAKFMESMAYNVLFMELATDEEKAAEFINSVLPEEVTKPQNTDADKPS